MARTLAAAKERQEPPPFWQQLPRVFTYPAHGDAIVRIVAFSIAAGIAKTFAMFGSIVSVLLWVAIWLGFLKYCFGILERTARGHLNPAEIYINESTGADRRPIKQFAIFLFFFGLAAVAGAMFGELALQVGFVVAALVIPAAIMVLALEESLRAAVNPLRIVATIAGIGLPYLALCAFLFLLMQSSEYLEVALDFVLPEWLAAVVADMVTMYFMVSMYYLMGYALYQNHAALGIDVQVDTAMAARAVSRKAGEPSVLGPETQGLVSEGKLEEAAARVEDRLRREWDNNKLHDQYHKLLLASGQPKPLAKHVNEYAAKLVREKKAARAVEVYEAGRARHPELSLHDPDLALPLARQASELRRDATAFELLKGFDKRFPGHVDIPGVYMLAATILLERQGQYAMAQKIFQGVVQKYPQHPLAAEATRLAEVAGKMAALPA
jgi:hypothetical protein